MLSKRAKQMIISLAAGLSLFATAVSACACSHHQPQLETEPPSCHSSSHGEPTATAAEPAIPESFGTGCNCFVNLPSRAITAKSENKKSSVAKGPGLLAQAIVPTDVVLWPLVGPSDGSGPPGVRFKGRSRTAGPSRAPPRL